MQLVFPAGKDAFLRSYTAGGKRAARLASGLRCDGRRSKASRGRADIVCTVLGYIVDGACACDAKCPGQGQGKSNMAIIGAAISRALIVSRPISGAQGRVLRQV